MSNLRSYRSSARRQGSSERSRLDRRPRCRVPANCPRRLTRESARRERVDEDVHHACDHALVVDQLDLESDPPKLLVIGPDRAGRLLEVIVLVFADERLMAIHAIRRALREHLAS